MIIINFVGFTSSIPELDFITLQFDSFLNDKGDELQTSLRHIPRLKPTEMSADFLFSQTDGIHNDKKAVAHDGSLQTVLKSRRQMPSIDMEMVLF